MRQHRYHFGLVERIEVHEQVLPQKQCYCAIVGDPGDCRACGGTGGYEGECHWCGGNGVCNRCGGDGVYLPEKRVRHHCFYMAGGYSFHQPTELVTWPITEPLPEPKPMPPFPEHRGHGLRSHAETVLDEAILVRTLELAYSEGLLARPDLPNENTSPGLASTVVRAVTDPSVPDQRSA